VTERLPKSVLIGAAVLGSLVLAYAALSRPGYFTNPTYFGGLILLEFLIAAVWMYRRIFFPIVIVTFLLAGSRYPVGTVWTSARWGFLAVGALVGSLIMLKERGHHGFGLFHATAVFAVLTALLSASFSRYPEFALLKVLSLFLLFLYAGTGARLAVTGREDRFFNGLLIGCEVFVGANAALYAVGLEPLGNPNSLGAVMGVACAPILLWGALLGDNRFAQRRRCVLYAICVYLVFASHSRAGLAAVLVSSGLLCMALRKYKLFIQGSVIILILVAASGIVQPEAISSLFTSVVYKGGDREHGMLASRESPWQAAVESIRDHPWLGTGLGTTASGGDASAGLAKFSSTSISTTENGSSYLTITSGVGVLGVPPFSVLLILLVGKILRTVTWMRRSGSATHPAIPLAMVMVAGMVHAAFEDWMFAPGYYLCLFFWSLAFVFADVAPSSRVPGLALRWHPNQAARAVGAVALR
jgi:O-antigen ligase